MFVSIVGTAYADEDDYISEEKAAISITEKFVKSAVSKIERLLTENDGVHNKAASMVEISGEHHQDLRYYTFPTGEAEVYFTHQLSGFFRADVYLNGDEMLCEMDSPLTSGLEEVFENLGMEITDFMSMAEPPPIPES